jgi:hypothetical protein
MLIRANTLILKVVQTVILIIIPREYAHLIDYMARAHFRSNTSGASDRWEYAFRRMIARMGMPTAVQIRG